MAGDVEAVSKLEKLFHALLASTAPELDPTKQAMEIHNSGKLGERVGKCVVAEGPDFWASNTASHIDSSYRWTAIRLLRLFESKRERYSPLWPFAHVRIRRVPIR